LSGRKEAGMKKKIRDFLTNILETAEYTLKYICLRPSPVKRFIMVLAFGSALAAANIYFVVSSIYNIGKRDAENEFLELKHIEQLKIENGELKIKNKDYEHEQQSGDK
jgi:hypothetical protein